MQSAAEQAHEQMLARLSALEAAAAALSDPAAGIGHNKPPEPIEPPPLNADELQKIRRNIAFLKALPAVSKASADAPRAATWFKTAGEHVLAYLMKQGDNLISEGVKALGKQGPLWLILGDRLIAAGDAIVAWLKALPLQ